MSQCYLAGTRPDHESGQKFLKAVYREFKRQNLLVWWDVYAVSAQGGAEYVWLRWRESRQLRLPVPPPQAR
jgi:hypothetical protein